MPIKLLIIGGGAGGASAAARARRLDESAQIVLFERGEYISFANCGLPYYIGQVIKDPKDLLMTTLKEFEAWYNIDIRIHSEVIAIDREKKELVVKNLKTAKSYRESYDRVILSPGAGPINPAIPGFESDNVFSLRNIADADRIKSLVDTKKPQSAVVVGGGFIGLEMVENLVLRGVETIIVEQVDQVMPPFDSEMGAIIHNYLKEMGIRCELENGVTSFSQRGEKIIVSTTKGHEIECDMVISSIGVKPESRLAREAGLEIGVTGGIKVNDGMQTSDPHIYAVGDAVEVIDFVTGLPTKTAFAGPANKQGRIAADNALGRKSVFRGTLGASVVKIFDVVVARTGASEKELERHNIPYLASYTHSDSHDSYYPGGTAMAIKLIFSADRGKLLGAQIVGRDGVDKRIDILATAIRGNMTVFDLEELELAYAPPFSSAKDPVNIAGFVSANILKGDMEAIYWNQLDNPNNGEVVLIDLRDQDELEETGMIDGALHVPLDSLRQKLPEFQKDKTYITLCAGGLRAYLGYRILTQNGFRAATLSGGYGTYLPVKEKETRGH